ncbi:putative developmental regulatory protein wetA [Elsinoe fawcettii]|nr:putative developmental regulatory protein wetA [Elsinoe fawcettii]
MMSQSRYRPSLEEMLSQVQSNVPLVPMVEKKWHFRHPPSPPTSTETDDSFLPVRGLVFPMSNNETLARPAHLLDPLIVSDNLVHTPITSPLEDNYFPAVLEDHWANTYNNNSVSFNANTIDGPRSLNGRRYSYTENDVPTPPSFNPWTKANATSPAPLTFDAAMLRSVPTQAVMSAPALKPGQFGSGFPTDYTTQAILLGQALLPADVNVSPRTSTFPTGTPNFSLPYRSQRLGSPQRESRPPSILPAHQRATPKLPAQQGEDLNARRTRSSSRARTSKHHRRTKSGPEPTNEACSAGRPSRRRDGKSGHLAGFVNFTPDDSQKLLTGVAPSGSSKTKARREHEAREKRRRLSQAAVKAVREGDLGALREAGLVMEDV